ncbi:MAG: NAD(P)H-dependent oxidoreductase [Anaerolineales bacterium]|nr:NAD(P)H-dependent oxidoreductase [Anaerolineales bacterium]
MARVLIVYHTQSGNTKAAAEAVAQGAKEVSGTEVIIKEGLNATVDDLLSCDAIAIGTPDYFSYMAGTLKTFMDDIYIAERNGVEGITGKPVVLFMSHGGGGRAKEPFEKLFNRLGDVIGETVESSGAPSASVLDACRALGKSLAARL